MFEGLGDSMRRLTELMKEKADAAIGWRVDERKLLKVKKGDTFTEVFDVEVMYEPTFGFTPKRQAATVRFTIDLDTPDGQLVLDSVGEGGVTLFEGDKLFGVEKGWKGGKCSARDNILDIWLHD
jgi:hypothetical protein